MGQLGPEMEKRTEELGKMQFGGNDGAAATAMAFVDKDRIRDEVRRARRDALRHAREAREATREARENAREAAREARRAGRDFRFSYGEDGRLKTTHIDMNKAQIIYHDDKGELKIENVAGKKVLTAKDPQGRLVFSGPVGTPEELEKVPAEVRQRYDKLEQKDLPAVTPAITGQEQANEAREEDEEEDAEEDEGATEVLQVLRPETRPFPHRRLGVNTILI
jgi:hypothetical protein